MARPRTKTTSKTLTLTHSLLENAETVAGYLGVSFPEYVRNLIINDTRRFIEKIPTLDEETIISLGRALKEVKQKKGKLLQSKEDIEELLNESFKD